VATHHTFTTPRKLSTRVRRCVEILKPLRKKFYAIAMSGASGMVVGGAVCHLLHKQPLVVRREGEEPVSGDTYPSHLSAGGFIILDDFVCNGTTILNIINQLHAHPEFVLLYNRPRLKDNFMLSNGEYLFRTSTKYLYTLH
jgi:adenine/guanine phosphoribosyltransferase-like PRPP-binding protein